MISMMSPSEPGRAEPNERRRASQTKCINSPLYCLPAFCYSLRFTIYHLPLPFAIALCGFFSLRSPLSRLLDKFTRRSIDSFQLSPESRLQVVTQYLKISPARQLASSTVLSIKLQAAATTPTSFTHTLQFTLFTLSSPAGVAFVLRFVHKLVTSEYTITKDGG